MDVQPKLNRRSRSVDVSRSVTKKDSAKSVQSNPEKSTEDINKLREEKFQKWLQTKKQQKSKEQENKEKIKDMIEQQKQIRKEAAALSYALWKHKKDRIIRGNELMEHRLAEEQEHRKTIKQQVSKEVVTMWMKTAKSKPRPVPSNMGLLSLTTTNPPSFFNPQPWVDPV